MSGDVLVGQGESRDADTAINERAQEHSRHPDAHRPLDGLDDDRVRDEQADFNSPDDEEEAPGYGHGV